MKQQDAILTPELVKILKIFLLSAFGLVIVLSFFNDYRADNTGEDRTFKVSDSDRIYFQNVRSIYYDREVRQDAGMVFFRHGKRLQSESQPTLDLAILLNPVKDKAYVFFELTNADWPVQIRATSSTGVGTFDFSEGNNQAHYELFQKLVPEIERKAEFELVLGGKSHPLWAGEKEKEALKTVVEDYLRLLAKTH